MKIHDLEEGRIYTSNGIKYRILKGKLQYFNLMTEKWSKSNITYNGVIEKDFFEIPQYVTVEEAVEHMKKGGIAVFNDTEFRISDTGCSEINESVGNGCYVLDIHMFEPKWILL